MSWRVIPGATGGARVLVSFLGLTAPLIRPGAALILALNRLLGRRARSSSSPRAASSSASAAADGRRVPPVRDLLAPCASGIGRMASRNKWLEPSTCSDGALASCGGLGGGGSLPTDMLLARLRLGTATFSFGRTSCSPSCGGPFTEDASRAAATAACSATARAARGSDASLARSSPSCSRRCSMPSFCIDPPRVASARARLLPPPATAPASNLKSRSSNQAARRHLGPRAAVRAARNQAGAGAPAASRTSEKLWGAVRQPQPRAWRATQSHCKALAAPHTHAVPRPEHSTYARLAAAASVSNSEQRH
mmetsp:Transcript_2977/g.9121  ORF Transcript_2977/g.9121 Transcript_2977/m.9121 type:complete len:308 (+) Transcript_2977:417-1340(+)